MRLHVDEFGSGPRTLVMLHGASGDRGTWTDIMPRLVERGYRVLTPDLRGHGLSGHAESYALTAFADDLVETLPAGVDVIAGHSLGGRVLAAAVTGLRPGRAIYLDPAFEPGKDIADGTFPQFADGTPMTREEYRGFHPEWSDHEIDQSLASYGRWDNTMLKDPDLLPQASLPPIPPPCPSLVVLADPTHLVTPETQKTLLDGGYEVRVQRGAGHVLHADDPDGFLAVLEGWV